MSEENASKNSDIWVSVLIIGRVVLMLVIWIGLFLAIFLGYFTYPLILIGLLVLIYALSDLGLFVAFKKRKQKQNVRDEFLGTYPENPMSDEE